MDDGRPLRLIRTPNPGKVIPPQKRELAMIPSRLVGGIASPVEPAFRWMLRLGQLRNVGVSLCTLSVRQVSRTPDL
jgi:hypothetical protein